MEAEEFDDFYAASFQRLVHQVHAMVGDRDEAQECVQEAFVRAWSHRRRLDRSQAPEAWVRTTAYRLAVSRWRRTVRARRAPDRALQPVEPAAGPSADQVAVIDALRRLPEAQRRALVLHHLCDLPVHAVAAETGVPEGTVKARLSRGRAALAALLGDTSAEKEPAMPDPFETLRQQQEHRVDRLPADEVRRRGDRARTRRAAVQGLAATMAVVAVVGGVAVGSGAVDRSAPQPPPASQDASPTPSESVPSPSETERRPRLLAIPADFPLAAADPAFSLEPSFEEISACDRTAPQTEPTDERSMVSQQPEDYRARRLTVYPSATEAAEQLTALTDFFAACPLQEFPPGPATIREVKPSDLGDQAATVVSRSEFEGQPVPGIEVVEIVRVANALLLTAESNEGGMDGGRSSERHSRTQAVPVVQAMCVFAADGCDVGTGGLLTVADLEHVTDFRTEWVAPDGAGFSSDDCRETIPATLLDEDASAALYEGRSAAGVLNARAISTFTTYASPEAAEGAFSASRDDLAACSEDPVASVDRGTTSWRMFSSPAPEVCTECGTAWLHAVGVALVDDRVVAVNLSRIGDLELVVGAEDPPPMSAVLSLAADIAGQER